MPPQRPGCCSCKNPASQQGPAYGGAGQTPMSAKYVQTPASPTESGSQSKPCLESIAYASGTAVAHDPIDGGCWAITGMRVPIGETYASLQAFAEIVNMNFAVNGSQPAVPHQLSLAGPTLNPNLA